LRAFYTDADYLLHEATFLQDEIQLAISVGHSTAYEAGLIANEAGVKCTILNHFSPRHPIAKPLVDEANRVNPNVIGAEDFMEIEF
jgi:ribonuclease Z